MAARDIPYQICRLALGHELPTDLDAYRGIIIFGGPMSVNDADTIPFIRDELDWLPTVVDHGVPLFGICLGAQLIASSLGGTISRRDDDHVEVGYAPLTPTDHGLRHGLFEGPMRVFQWHQDGISLPDHPDIHHHASSPLFPVQAFTYQSHVLGVQFHPEVSRAMWHKWIIRAHHMLEFDGAQNQQDQLMDRMVHDVHTRNWLDKILPAWLDKSLLD